MDHKENLNNYLRQLKARAQNTIQPQATVPRTAEGIDPSIMMQLDLTDPHAILRAKLALLSLKKPMAPAANKLRYVDVPNLTATLQIVEKDFPDNKYLDEEGVFVQRKDLAELCEIGRQTIPMFSTGFNTEGVVALFTLAYNLRIPHTEGEGYIFEEMSPEVAAMDADGATLINVQYSGAHTEMCCGLSNNPDRDAIFYCYLAASTLRLFTKSPENYIGAWTNILQRFCGFYGFSPPITPIPPTQQAMAGLHSAFSSDYRMKMTLYKLLYHTQNDMKHEGLRRFLYEIHLANSGLHAVGIFANLCISLGMNSKHILQTMYTPEFERQIDALSDFVRMMTTKGEGYDKRMWRFGRVFNENFMSTLQTKACPKFVYILACMLKTEDPAKCRNILDIVQIKGLSEAVKMKCSLVAQNLLNAFRSSEDQNEALAQ
ncbi:unnamed protein product [Cuscuta europaea]|uniref:Uncharacterized protein n=1 Tax=Cuscuta europaea TaxID=41803 RepID=A0A9P1A2R7_CUSEU|nr:unnamed protein product [Cuscuta europaea]